MSLPTREDMCESHHSLLDGPVTFASINIKAISVYKTLYVYFKAFIHIQLDYTLIEIDENELVDKKTNKSLNIEPMQLMRPPNIKRGDHIYVLQHPRGDEFSFSSSESIVLGEKDIMVLFIVMMRF